MRITRAADEQLGFRHPGDTGWNHISFCLFAGPTVEADGALQVTHAVAIRPGKIDRSPTGTAVSARMAVLHAKGRMEVGDRYVARSIIGSVFEGHIAETTTVGGRAAIVPVVSGSAWITGTHQLMLDPADPYPLGYRLSDTWPAMP